MPSSGVSVPTLAMVTNWRNRLRNIFVISLPGGCSAGFISPGCLDTGLVREAGVGVVAELDLLIQDPGFYHQIAHHIEVCFARGKGAIGDPVHRLGQGPSQQRGVLVVVEAGHEIRGVLTMGLARIQPEAGTGDAVHQGLDDLWTLIDKVLAYDQNARHVVRPILASLKQDSSKAAYFRLRWKGLPHHKGIDGMGREGAGNIGGRHLDHLDLAGLDTKYLHSAEEQQALVGKAARNGNGAAAHIGKGLDGAVLADDDCAAVTVAQGY